MNDDGETRSPPAGCGEVSPVVNTSRCCDKGDPSKTIR